MIASAAVGRKTLSGRTLSCGGGFAEGRDDPHQRACLRRCGDAASCPRAFYCVAEQDIRLPRRIADAAWILSASRKGRPAPRCIRLSVVQNGATRQHGWRAPEGSTVPKASGTTATRNPRPRTSLATPSVPGGPRRPCRHGSLLHERHRTWRPQSVGAPALKAGSRPSGARWRLLPPLALFA